MANTREILRAQAEWVLWNGRKVVYRSRVEELQSKYILEQDDVNRMQIGLSGFLSKRKRGYEEKLEKEMAEAAAVKEELERLQKLVAAADEKLPILELQLKAFAEEWEKLDGSLLHGEEKEIYQWCKETEKCVKVVKEINFCIAKLKEMQDDFGALQEESTPLLQLQKRIDLVWLNARTFVEELEGERKYDLSFLAEEDSSFMQFAKTYRCGLTRNITAVDAIADLVRTNNSLHGLDMELQELRKRLTEVFDAMTEAGEGLLQKAGGEQARFEREMPSEHIYIEETPAKKMETEKVSAEKEIFEGIGLFGEVDLTKEKERVLFGLDLLRKEFLRLTEQAEKGDGMQHWLHRSEKKENELLDAISGWEKALREWQNDLKLYRKDAGNFSCALDGYRVLEMKIWQYGEDDGAELQKTCREHLRETEEMLAKTERQIREFEKE